MVNSIKMLVFDLDGTLIDSKKDICLGVNLALKKMKRDPLPESVVEEYVAIGIQPLMRQIFADDGVAFVEQAIEEFKTHYGLNLTTHTQLYDRIPEVLLHYSDVPKVILTNKSNIFMDPILKALDLEKYFVKSYGRSSFPTQKPDAGPLLAIAKEFGLNPEDLVMIGDSDVDILAGKNANTKTCAVLYGYGNHSQLTELKPDFAVKKPQDLLGLFGPSISR